MRRGFTLLEVAVALGILGVGVVSCLEIFSASLRMIDRATRETSAVREARTAMDCMMSVVEEFQDAVWDHCPRERTTAEGFTTRSDWWKEKLEKERDLTLHGTHALYHLQVTVTWQDGKGAKTYTLDTLRALQENE
jgi:prepilin-type N-terminal cleavage/methylation domain-containing protein